MPGLLRRFWAPVTVLLLAALGSCGGDGGGQDCPDASACATPSPFTATLVFDNGSGERPELEVEIADTPGERSAGLMNRQSLPPDAGMLFVFAEDTESGFWMKDTLIPLSIAFVRADGVIVEILDMEPLDETLHRPGEPYRYAVEANRGWFEEKGVEPGDRMISPAGLAP